MMCTTGRPFKFKKGIKMNSESYPNTKTNKLKYVAYVRKSTEEKERQQMSIEAQVEAINKQFPELNITFIKDTEGDIGESMSAAKPGRPVFNQMIVDIDAGKYDGIVAWHPDRIARNMLDSATVVWRIQQGELKDLKFCNFTFENTPEGIMMLQNLMSQAEYFSRKLSKDIKRGNATKRNSKGQLTGLVPTGYISVSTTNNGRNTVAMPDPERFSIIQKSFKMYLTGSYTVPEIVTWLNDECGYLSPKHTKTGGRPMARSTYYSMLQNPRYAGLIPDPQYPKDPEHYIEAKYQAMITPVEYDEIQRLLGRRGGPRICKGKFFALKGLLKCGECGHSVTAEGKIRHHCDGSKVKHTYYRCTLKSKQHACSQHSYTNEQELFAQIEQLLGKYEIDEQLHQWGLEALEELAQRERAERDVAQEMQFDSSKTIQKRLDNLLDLVTDGTITPEDYKKKSQNLKDQLAKNQRAQAETSRKVNDWYNIVETTLTYLDDAHAKFVNGDIGVKRMVLRAIGQNATLTDGKIGLDVHYWVKPIAEFLENNQGKLKKVRTELQQIEKAPNGALLTKWCWE